MLSVVGEIRKDGLQAVVNRYGLRTNTDGRLVQLNYHITSPKGVQASDECRGLILDSQNDWAPVAMPFYRFYNEHEGHADKVNLDSTALWEKRDGSMAILYWHPEGMWECATRGSVRATGQVGQTGMTYSELFWKTMQQYGGTMPEKNLCVVFELTSPVNRIVTPYGEDELRLLAARNMQTMSELGLSELEDLSLSLGVPLPQMYTFDSRDNIMNMLNNLSNTDEGFVLTDYGLMTNVHFARVKVKNPRYVALHRLVGAGEAGINKRLFALVRANEMSEVLSYFPEYKNQMFMMKNRYDVLIAQIECDLDRLWAQQLDKKAFALAVKDHPQKHVLFAVNNNKARTVLEALENVQDEQVLEWMHVELD